MGSSCLLAEINPTWMLLAGIAILTSVMVRLTYRRSRQPASRSRPGNAPATAVPLPSHHEVLRRLEEKEVEFDEISRTALARLDNKIAILQRLLAESDQAIARLEEAQRHHLP